MADFFTSDLHFGHEKLLSLGRGRPFGSAQEMDREIVRGINLRMRPNDTLYCLGDWCCGVGHHKQAHSAEMRAALIGIRIVYVRGNHDPRHQADFDALFDEVHELLHTKINGRRVTLCHYPLEHWPNDIGGAWHLHGHMHGAGVRHERKLRLDVGVDGNRFVPWSFDEVDAAMRALPWRPEEHHSETLSA